MAPRLYDAAQLREIERRAIATGIPGHTLMQRAAAACWREIQRRWPQARRLHVLCGPGNNGGDGYEIAGLALAGGCEVRVWQIGGAPQAGDAVLAHEAWLREGGAVQAWHAQAFDGAEVIVDALFGIGLTREFEGRAREAIAAMAASAAAVVAVDIPSGIEAMSGRVLGTAVCAQLTVTFIARKPGLYQGAGAGCAGEIVFDDLGVPLSAYDGIEPQATVLAPAALRGWLPPRARESHKGHHGHVLVIGGDHGMMGAALLAARGALRAGAGWVSVATRAAHAPVMTAAQPELMAVGTESARDLAPLIERADVIVAGPGMGQNAWGRELFAALLQVRQPLVLDADALNLLAQEPLQRESWVLTPHPGEAARLLQMGTLQVQADRLDAARRLQQTYGGTVVLKGAGSLIRQRRTLLCPYGNPGMAVGGMGDVLAGIIAAFIAQGLAAPEAAAAGVLAHALAGDAAAQGGQRGLLPSDLLDALRSVVNS